jgi:anti-sigma B factor antagonist
MNMNELTTSVRHKDDGVGIIDVQGVLTSQSEEKLMAAYNQAVNEQNPIVIFNFTDMDYINSSGIGLLITILIRAKRQGHKLVACGLKDHFRQIFQLTRLDEAMPVYLTEDEAYTALIKESTTVPKG